MTAGVKRCEDGGQIAILGAGSMGRLWAALLPPSCCGFLPRLDSFSQTAELSSSAPEDGAGHRGGFSRPEGTPETRCEYALIRPASPDIGVARTFVSLPWLRSAADMDVLLVTTKAGDTLSALEGWLPHIAKDTPVVLFQNGLGSQQAVAERWPERPVLAASTTEGANRPEPDVLVHAGTGDTWVGPLTDSASAATESVVQWLAQSGLQVHTENSIVQQLWQKLVVNAGINAFTALLDCPNGAIVDAPLYRQTIDELCTEIAALLQADTGERTAPQALRERIEAVAKSTASNTSSMRADANAGRKTEIDFINGYLVQCGRRHGIATAVNQMLVQRVQAL